MSSPSQPTQQGCLTSLEASEVEKLIATLSRFSLLTMVPYFKNHLMPGVSTTVVDAGLPRFRHMRTLMDNTNLRWRDAEFHILL